MKVCDCFPITPITKKKSYKKYSFNWVKKICVKYKDDWNNKFNLDILLQS